MAIIKNTIIDVSSVQVLDRLYVFETTPYEIEYDESVTRIYVVDECYDAFLELNPTAPLKKFNPEAIQAALPEWYEYVCVAIDEDSNSALLSLLYDNGLIENEDYATYAEIRAINSSQFADAFSSASSLTSFDEFELFTGVKKLGDYAFSGCPNMESIKFPESVYKLGKNVLAGCNSLENVEVDGNNAHFYSPEGSNLIVDKTTRTIVAGCGSSTIPSDVYYIGDYAFAGSNLTEITIPSNIREIGDHAFDGCSALEYIEMESENPPKIGDNVFDDVSEDFEIDVPEDAVETYTEDDGWSQYAEYINGGQPQPHPKDLSDDEFGLESDDITITNEQMPVIIPLVNTHDLPVTYASSDTSIATVDQTGAVTLSYDNGNTNITVSFAGNDEYKAKTLTYAVTVAIPQELSDAEFSWSASSATATEAGSFSGVTLINTHGLSVSYSSSDTSVATIEPTYGHTIVSADGTTVISAAFAGNAQYKAKTVTYTLTVALAQDLTDQEFGLSSSSTTISTEGATVTLPVINIYNLPVTYTTSNNVVAMVDANGNVTLSYVDGVALISIAFAGNSTYKAKTLVYTITVDMPAQIEHVMHTTFTIPQNKAGLDIPLVHENRHTSYFNSVIIDNVEMPMTYTYQFTEGNHTVDYKIVSSTPQLGDGMFNSVNQMTSAYIPDGITAIPFQLFFNNTGVSYIGVPSSVTTVAGQSFRGATNLNSLVFPDTLTSLAGETFRGSGVSYINIPSNITAVPQAILMQCANLTQFEIPAQVTTIQSQVFDRSALTELTCYNTTPPTINNMNAFNEVNLTAIYVPFANVPDYQAANNWSTYASIIQPIGGKHTLTDAEFNLDYVPGDIMNSEDITNYIINTHNLPLTFSSSDTSIMTIDSNGYIEVVSEGYATITVTFAGNGQYLPKTLTTYLYGYISISDYPVKLTSHPISESKAEKYSYTKIFSSITNKYYPNVYDIDVSENITSILVDGNEIGTSSYLYTFSNPTEEHTVEYSFVDNVNLPKWTFRRDTKFSSVVQNEYYDNKYPLRNYPTTYMISNNASSDVLEIGEGVESIGSSFFTGAAIKRIVLPSTFKFAYNYAFNGIEELKRIYSYAATPPILSYVSRPNEQVSIYGSADANGNISKPNFYLIVPDESVELYRNSAYWQQTWSSQSKIEEYIIGFSQEPYIGKYGIVTKVSSDGENPTQIFNGDKYTAEPQQNLLMASLLSTTTDNNFDIEAFWNRPLNYIDKLLKFQAVIGLDLSACVDFPRPQKEYNVYRNRVCDSFIQRHGQHVIPLLRGDPDTIEREVAGLTVGCMVAVSPRGCSKDIEDRRRFIRGLQFIVDTLQPNAILSYGGNSYGVLDYPMSLGIEVYVYPSRGRGDVGGGALSVKVR